MLKNTSAAKDSTNHANLRIGINRSQSLLTTNTRLPVLAPARSERARLENILTDVWSRDILPFPGMTARIRSEHLVRSSASSVMRKLSVASITSSFGKRSGSVSHGGKAAGLVLGDEALSQADSISIAREEADDGRSMTTLQVQQQVLGGRHEWVSSPTEALFLEELLASEAGLRQHSSDRTHTDSTESAPTETTAATDVLQISPSNSIRLKQSLQFDTKAVGHRAKENEAHHSLDRTKSFSRWSTKSQVKSNNKGHGIRNLFR